MNLNKKEQFACIYIGYIVYKVYSMIKHERNSECSVLNAKLRAITMPISNIGTVPCD